MGEFKDGVFDGLGAYYDLNQQYEFRGMFKEGELGQRWKLIMPKNQFCIMEKVDERVHHAKCYEKDNTKYYEGDYQDFNFTGNGVFYFENGEKYSGEFKNGVPNGYGRRLDRYGDILY